MIPGNDIVDLQRATIESNWRRAGYLQKIFSAKEIEDIHTSIDPNKMVWLYWSMKETAYKCISRALKLRFYSPAKLTCDLDDIAESQVRGYVQYEDFKIETSSKVTSEYISTFSRNFAQENHNLILVINPESMENPGQAIRRKIHTYLSNYHSQPSSRFSIIKDTLGIPSLRDFKKGISFPISISHHGRFGSFSLPLIALD